MRIAGVRIFQSKTHGSKRRRRYIRVNTLSYLGIKEYRLVMSKPTIHLFVNTSKISQSDLQVINSLNGTFVGVASQEIYRDSQLNELLYVVIVIMFYAMALMVLIATQIKKQGRGHEIEYYDEYLERNDRLKKKKKMLATISKVPEEEHSLTAGEKRGVQLV